MKLETRTTKTFINIKVDEIETTIFSSSKQELNIMINNLLDVVAELAYYTDKSVSEYVKQGEF